MHLPEHVFTHMGLVVVHVVYVQKLEALKDLMGVCITRTC